MLSLPHRRALLGRAAAFDPLSLGPLAWWSRDPATLFSDVAGLQPIADNQTVALRIDKSGHGRHATQADATKRPLYRAGPARLQYDGVNDCLVAPGVDNANVDIFMSFRTTDANGFLFIGSNSLNPWLGALVQGSASTQLSQGAGAPTYRVNGADQSFVTRNDEYVACATGLPVVVSILGASLTATAGWANIVLFSYISGTSVYAGDDYETLIYPHLPTADQHKVEQYLMAAVGA
jgi:hypothetical protein